MGIAPMYGRTWSLMFRWYEENVEAASGCLWVGSQRFRYSPSVTFLGGRYSPSWWRLTRSTSRRSASFRVEPAACQRWRPLRRRPWPNHLRITCPPSHIIRNGTAYGIPGSQWTDTFCRAADDL